MKQKDKLSTFSYWSHSYHQSVLCNKQIYNIYSKHHMQKLRNAWPANWAIKQRNCLVVYKWLPPPYMWELWYFKTLTSVTHPISIDNASRDYSSNTDTCVRASAHVARICVAATPVRRARAPQDVSVLRLHQSGPFRPIFLRRAAPPPPHPVSLGLFLATLWSYISPV